MDELKALAVLLKQRDAIDEQIAKVIDRPASTGHIGEFIASKIFAIDLTSSASNKGHDGHFLHGPLAGKTVNIKFYAKQGNMLDLPQNAEPTMAELANYYLVLAGPIASAALSKGTHQPLVIQKVFLFEAKQIIQGIHERAMNKHGKPAIIGTATSVPKQFWDEAEIYPQQRNNTLSLTPEQQQLLALFS